MSGHHKWSDIRRRPKREKKPVADRIYKGKLVPKQDPAFPEAACDFHKPHAGGLVPFDMLREVLMVRDPCLDGTEDIGAKYEEIDGSLWLSRGDVWVKIDPDGTIEVGASGV